MNRFKPLPRDGTYEENKKKRNVF